ncbi:hypothetical protein C2U72_04065 [Prosthecomicrobium hirschii]|nr:hypothetical protein C2U72_04065 [Prosthecomicrobium hirschii]
MDAAARHLHVTEKTWSMGGCLMRVSHARRIVESGRVDDAMKLIAKSKIDPILTRIAEQWISGDRIKAFTV